MGDAVGAGVGLMFGESAGRIANAVTDVGGKFAVNDLDYAITFSYSFFIAVGGLVCQSIMAWMVCLFVADVRDRELFNEVKGMAGYDSTGQHDPYANQHDPYAQQGGQQ